MSYGPPYRHLTSQRVVYPGSGTSAASSKVSAQCNVVRLLSTTDCFIKITDSDPTPTASSSDMFMRASDEAELFIVTPGQQVAVIGDGTGGELYVTELTR